MCDKGEKDLGVGQAGERATLCGEVAKLLSPYVSMKL